MVTQCDHCAPTLARPLTKQSHWKNTKCIPIKIRNSTNEEKWVMVPRQLKEKSYGKKMFNQDEGKIDCAVGNREMGF